ncbi:MAG: hypothetical protein WCQ48_02815, partial [Chloroflexota bacterium]
MNDHPPLEPVGDASLEARIVAWVLGEASGFEVGELERLCQERPERLVFRRRMRALHGLLSEAESAEADDAWKLPPEKRAKIEELFGESPPQTTIPVLQPERVSTRWLLKTILTAAACVMFGMLYRFGFAGNGSSSKLAMNEEHVTKSMPQLSRAIVNQAEAVNLPAPPSAKTRASWGRSDESSRIAGEKQSQSFFDSDRTPAAGVDHSYKAKAAQAVADTESLASGAKPNAKVVRGFTYSNEYEPPEVPNAGPTGLGLSSNADVGGFALGEEPPTKPAEQPSAPAALAGPALAAEPAIEGIDDGIVSKKENTHLVKGTTLALGEKSVAERDASDSDGEADP